MSDTTLMGVFEDAPGYDAFLSSLSDDPTKKQGLSDGVEGAPDTQPETTEQPEATDGEQDETPADPDDQEIEVKVGEEVKKTTLRDLKRLWGQEASLTQKSQRASEQLKAAEEAIQRTALTSKAILERAQANYQPYAELDWLVLAQQLPTDQFQQLRSDAAAAKKEVDFLTAETEAFMQANQQQAFQAHQKAADECVKVLSDPATGIEGFGKPLYDEMMTFCQEQGLTTARQSTNPVEYKILHMAMQWQKHQQSIKAAEGKAKKAVEKPTRTMKPTQPSGKNDTQRAAMNQLRRSGDIDDAVAAFRSTF